MRVYYAGKVPKGDDAGRVGDWRAELATRLSRGGDHLEMVSPENPSLDESDSISVFGHDCYLIRGSDLVIVNAQEKLGVGTAQEMLIAKYFGKTVLTILPPNTHHRRSNLVMFGATIPDWKHPFIVATSDVIFDSPDHLLEFLSAGKLRSVTALPKKIDLIDAAISHYLAVYGGEE